MNLEFAGRLYVPELILKDFTYWTIILKDGGTTLGHSVIILKSNKETFSEISEAEMAEFPKVCAWFEDKTKTLFGAIKWNYCAMMMKESFVHFQAIPRYDKQVNILNKEFVDKDYPRRPSFDKLEIDKETLLKLKDMFLSLE